MADNVRNTILLTLIENVFAIAFLCKIDIFSIQFIFYKINSNNLIKKLFELSKPNINFNSTFFVSNRIKNYQTIQIIKFLSFKSSNFFKFQIDIDTKPAPFILVKIRPLNVSNFQNILDQLSQLSKAGNKNIKMATISYCFCKNHNPIWKIEKFKSWKFTKLNMLFSSEEILVIKYLQIP